MYLSGAVVFAQWLCEGAKDLYELLKPPCDVQGENGILTVVCPKDAVPRIEAQLGAIAKAAFRRRFYWLIVKTNDNELVTQFDPATIMEFEQSAIPLIHVMPNTDRPIAIVRMADHKGLYCTDQIYLASGARPNDWIGKDMSKYHIADEMERYVRALMQHGYLDDFSYRALNFQGQEIEQTVRAWLTTWRGDLVRVVENLDSRLL